MTRKWLLLALAAASASSITAQAALHDRGGGLIYDDVLNITWLQDANYANTSGYAATSLMNWANANTWAANLSFLDTVRNVTYDDWRLPTVSPVNRTAFNFNNGSATVGPGGNFDQGYNISAPGSAYPGSTGSELAYMFYQNLSNPGFYTPAGTLSWCNITYPCLGNTSPFVNLQPGMYWSGTEYPLYSGYAMDFTMYDGHQYMHYKTFEAYAWAVRPGDVAAVPEPEAWVMLLAGLGLVGVAAKRRG
jgi:hypothetical protein